MSTHSFALVPAAYLFLVRRGEDGPEVLLQLRRNTGYMDGYWACGCAGHVEAGESVHEAAVREAREELGIRVDRADLRPLTTVHRTDRTDRPLEQRVDMFFAAERWDGTPRPMEPDKNAGLGWFALSAMPSLVPPHESYVLGLLAASNGGPMPAIVSFGFDPDDDVMSYVRDGRAP